MLEKTERKNSRNYRIAGHKMNNKNSKLESALIVLASILGAGIILIIAILNKLLQGGL
jgi:hypothetical protein